ncbi:alpha/beta hydrolase fold domain-containing protein [Horticoccus luteus]|uniref:Alpha/beta hydrolase fold domain-containing protein n=1 Tax=Horticoccus luteus TaxID=2862869 RepID=A0A8F9XIP1_9BACT|nr:pectinesterase family protein [Horticoccus luteus]QYM77798.1 alpha/beta hydrolase fold domain-containing protein [Horticoccus luteus]
MRSWLAVFVACCLLPFGARATPDAVVATDGSGQYRSVQEAISTAPLRTDPATPPWVILVKPGTYHERIYVQRERGHVRIVGEDAATTTITYDLSTGSPGPDGKPIGTFRTPTVQIDGDGMEWENITIANSAGPVGQALALRVEGDRVVFRHCRFLGWQDTILLNRGRQYFADCYIEGHVDFIFGGATAYFDRCEIHALKDGYLTAASTPKGQTHGFVFADGKITGAAGVKTYLGRPWRDYAQTVFLRTEMSGVVRAEGWHNWNKPQAEITTRYAEFGSTGPGANPAGRVPWAKALTAAAAAALTPAEVLRGHDGWNPAGRAPIARKVRIVLVGDSTVTDEVGWGRGFKQLLTDATECINTARGGRSSKSFRAEGHWPPALALHGDYYLIQFGHNDQPGKGPARETDAGTTFLANMARYVDEVRAIGAQPILVTSLTRRDFDHEGRGKIVSTLTPYVDAVRKVAAEKRVPLVDLYARSVELCERLGPTESATFNPIKNGKPDTTHLNAKGTAAFAALVADELRRVVPELAPFLRAEPATDVLRDIKYGEADGEPLLLDAHVPVGAGPFPVAILVHGGGWSRGDKHSVPAGDGADISPWFAPLSAANFTWFSINYRLAPEHRWPACFDDVETAIRWAKAHAAEFKGDPQRMALFGHSSGGHLVCLAATLAGEDTRVQAIVGFAPVTNHEQDLAARGGLSPSLQGLLNLPREVTVGSRAVLRDISPLNHVHAGLPPFLLLHGEADKTVPLQQSLDFQAKLRANGVRCDLLTIPGAPHALETWAQLRPDYEAHYIAWLREVLDAPAERAPQ